MGESVECPKCGKKTIVQRKNGLYECLACDFKKDFSQPTQSKSGNGMVFWIAAIIMLVLLLTLERRNPAPNTPNPKRQSSAVSTVS